MRSILRLRRVKILAKMAVATVAAMLIIWFYAVVILLH